MKTVKSKTGTIKGKSKTADWRVFLIWLKKMNLFVTTFLIGSNG